MSRTDHKRSGRVAFDSRGQAVWEWQLAPGVFVQDIDTQSLRALESQSDLALAESFPPQAGQRRGAGLAAGNPRDQGMKQHSAAEPPRKSLDDLRRLSEEIKSARQWPPVAKPDPAG